MTDFTLQDLHLRLQVSQMGPRRKPITYEVNERGCFICTSHSKNCGYPQVGIRRDDGTMRPVRLLRIVCEAAQGPVPPGLIVRHKCDDPGCINPDHLEIGTPADNRQDMYERERHARGDRSGTAKLTEASVLEIRQDTETPFAKLAGKYGVTLETVWAARSGRSWKHLAEPPAPRSFRSKTGVKGVWKSRHGRFIVVIKDGGKRRSHGTYPTLDEAAAVAARELAQWGRVAA